MTDVPDVYLFGTYSSRHGYHFGTMPLAIALVALLSAITGSSVIHFTADGDWRHAAIWLVMGALILLVAPVAFRMVVAFVIGSVERQVLDSQGAHFVMSGRRYSVPWSSVSDVLIEKRRWSDRFDIKIIRGGARYTWAFYLIRRCRAIAERRVGNRSRD